MHTPDTKPTPFPPQQKDTSDASSCPVRSPNHPLRKLAQQPDSSDAGSTRSKYNPLNYIPQGLTNTASAEQTYKLPLERENSTIPRPDTQSTWEYPSPQQMYNAMLRKGYTDTDVTAVESMVAVHNFLNEGAWAEILQWEFIFGSGLSKAWDVCSRGEQGIAQELARKEFAKARREALGIRSQQQAEEQPEPKLIRFQGFPQKPTPKAKVLNLLGKAFPARFGSDPPFDRHDWYVERRAPNGTAREVRYVIDYYSGGEEGDGQQVFYLDIRPALDTPTAVAERAMRWGGDVWYRASGGAIRENTPQK